MPEVPLSYISTQSLRDSLLAKNLPPYNVEGSFTSNVNNPTFEIVQTVSGVIDTPSVSTNMFSPMSQSRILGSLNQYGPTRILDGAEFITTLQTTNSTTTFDADGNPVGSIGNFNEYTINDEKLPIITSDFYRLAVGVNKFGTTANGLLYFVTTVILPGLGQPYYTNIIGNSSSYTLLSLLTEDNPQGSNGSLSNDTVLVKIGAQKLKDYFTERISREIADIANPINTDALSNPFEMITGVEPLIDRDFRITVGSTRILTTLERISGTYFPDSIIPGQYLTDPNSEQSLYGQIKSAFNRTGLGSLAQRIFRTNQDTPSELFLVNTGGAQKSFLFKNLDFNLYKPYYNRPILQRLANAINPFDNQSSAGYYYVGSKTINVSTLTSPSGELPENSQGEELSAIVYGQDVVSEEFEGKQISSIKFGLKGQATTDSSANVDGGFVWSSTKTINNAGKRAGISGGTKTVDPEYRIIENIITGHASEVLLSSTNTDFVRDNSLLVKTQQLIDAADKVDGQRKLKHAGNAINQISKVFHDGYKIMTKGSQVMKFTDDNSNPIGYEYCRVFTKDTPYYTHKDLQKTTARIDGGEINGNIRKSTYSVFDSTFNLNIAPSSEESSTNMFNVQSENASVKKYMFSIENLAWAGSTRAGLQYKDLPSCERGPNKGRVMWFPPYGISFSDTSTPNFHSNSFLGRPEPIYTYKDTTRTGTLSFKMIVDHPSIVNLLVDKVYKNMDDKTLNKILDSFFSGCKNYDLYDLATIYQNVPPEFFFEVENILGNETTIQQTIDFIEESATITTPNPNSTPHPPASFDPANYQGKYGFFYENDYPDPQTRKRVTTTKYQDLYSVYIGQQSNYEFAANPDQVEGINEMFSVIEYNWEKIQELMKNLYADLSEGIIEQCTITLTGTTSPTASESYNKDLANRRVSNIINTFKTYKFDGENTFDKLIQDGKLILKSEALGETKSVWVYGDNDFKKNLNCGDNDDPIFYTVNGEGGPRPNQIYSANAMGCRQVGFGKINLTLGKNGEQQPDNGEDSVTNTFVVTRPVTGTSTTTKEVILGQKQKVRQKIAKKLLRHLLSECSYFDMVKGEDPNFYDNMRQKLKHFHPAFHSMTPEGLNSRLTFLQQCVRPGDTIQTKGIDGETISNDAVNTSFGTPPVLVLRIGDFYNTKIIPNSLSITYDPLVLDLNPEGIGVQPMIANVSMGFAIIGGMGLKEPVDKLQNALSFNFYANTEMYDERADETESTKTLDEAIFAAIFDGRPITPITNNGVPETNGGTTIGDIQQIFRASSGTTGTTSYTKIMDTLLDSTIGYFDTVYQSTQKITNNYGYGMTQLTTKYHNCYNGQIRRFTSPTTSEIAGRYVDYQRTLEDLTNNLIDNIDTNYIVVALDDAGFRNSDIKKFKTNLINVFNECKVYNLNGVSEIINNLTTVQQNYTQILRKLDYVDFASDGQIKVNNSVTVYGLNSGSTVFSGIQVNYGQVGTDLNDFITLFKDNGFLTDTYVKETFAINPSLSNYSIQSQKMGTLMYGLYHITLIDDFVKKLTVNLNSVNSPQKMSEVIKSNLLYIMGLYYELQNSAVSDFSYVTTEFNKLYSKEKYTPFVKGIERTLSFTQLTTPTSQQQTELQNIYKTVNLTDELITFNDKIKFI
jgi:hypothetical protein